MRAVIIYYSFSGNTKMVSGWLKSYLQDKNFQADLIQLEPQDETPSFFGQSLRAFSKKRAQLKDMNFDMSNYDLICLGTPVWAFAPAPAVNTFLDKVSGLNGKKCIAFTTYGSGAGNNRCLNYMVGLLSSKGAQDIKYFSIQQFKVKDRESVEDKIKDVI